MMFRMHIQFLLSHLVTSRFLKLIGKFILNYLSALFHVDIPFCRILLNYHQIFYFYMLVMHFQAKTKPFLTLLKGMKQ